MTWAIRLSPELAKGVIGVARAFGTSILLRDQISIPDLADRFRPHRLTNCAADKHFLTNVAADQHSWTTIIMKTRYWILVCATLACRSSEPTPETAAAPDSVSAAHVPTGDPIAPELPDAMRTALDNFAPGFERFALKEWPRPPVYNHSINTWLGSVKPGKVRVAYPEIVDSARPNSLPHGAVTVNYGGFTEVHYWTGSGFQWYATSDD